MSVQLYQGDCLDLLPLQADAVITDPPYGVSHNTRYNRFTGGVPPVRRDYKPVGGDDKEFDPSPWLEYSKVVLFGAHCFSDKLPCGSFLVWLKRRDSKMGAFLSDCEIAWQKGGYGVYAWRHVWDGFDKDSERGEPRLHPTQKPIALMRWVLERQRLHEGATILDPYMGVGATGIAAVQLGLNFIGIERDPGYFKIAQERINKAQEAAQQLTFEATA